MGVHPFKQMLGHLNHRERLVVMYRFGLYGGDEMTLEQVGAILGVTRERARQLEAKALRKLQWKASDLRVGFADLV